MASFTRPVEAEKCVCVCVCVCVRECRYIMGESERKKICTIVNDEGVLTKDKPRGTL